MTAPEFWITAAILIIIALALVIWILHRAASAELESDQAWHRTENTLDGERPSGKYPWGESE